MLNHELLNDLKVRTVDEFEEEFDRIVQRKPNSSRIFSKVLELLDFISRDRNPDVFTKHKQIEKPKGTQGLYAIKIKVECNIRILFSLERDGTILLHTFEEIAGKRNTGYSPATSIAKERLKEYRRGGSHEKKRK